MTCTMTRIVVPGIRVNGSQLVTHRDSIQQSKRKLNTQSKLRLPRRTLRRQLLLACKPPHLMRIDYKNIRPSLRIELFRPYLLNPQSVVPEIPQVTVQSLRYTLRVKCNNRYYTYRLHTPTIAGVKVQVSDSTRLLRQLGRFSWTGFTIIRFDLLRSLQRRGRVCSSSTSACRTVRLHRTFSLLPCLSIPGPC